MKFVKNRKDAPLRPFTLTIYLHFEDDACKLRIKTLRYNTKHFYKINIYLDVFYLYTYKRDF